MLTSGYFLCRGIQRPLSVIKPRTSAYHELLLECALGHPCSKATGLEKVHIEVQVFGGGWVSLYTLHITFLNEILSDGCNEDFLNEFECICILFSQSLLLETFSLSLCT